MANAPRGSGGRILFAECDPFRALQACFEGVRVETVMSEIDIFVSSTGVITLDHMKKLNEITVVGNTGHFDNEIDFAGSGDVFDTYRGRKAGFSGFPRLPDLLGFP